LIIWRVAASGYRCATDGESSQGGEKKEICHTSAPLKF
jgi:hypothetical protein